MKSPTIVAYGGGTNSTAMLIELSRQKTKIDLILFANTGGEKPQTYQYVNMFSKWCEEHGLPPIQIINRTNFRGVFETLEAMCIRLKTLPSIAYGYKTCSLKYKKEPQDKFVNNWPIAKKAWSAGVKVIKLIGYDADEPQRAKPFSDEKYDVKYPLIEWGWGRQECLNAIDKVNLERPGKSSCFFCPSMKREEIIELKTNNSILYKRAIKLETLVAEGPNGGGTTRGLGRSLTWPEKIEIKTKAKIEISCDCYDEADE